MWLPTDLFDSFDLSVNGETGDRAQNSANERSGDLSPIEMIGGLADPSLLKCRDLKQMRLPHPPRCSEGAHHERGQRTKQTPMVSATEIPTLAKNPRWDSLSSGDTRIPPGVDQPPTSVMLGASDKKSKAGQPPTLCRSIANQREGLAFHEPGDGQGTNGPS